MILKSVRQTTKAAQPAYLLGDVAKAAGRVDPRQPLDLFVTRNGYDMASRILGRQGEAVHAAIFGFEEIVDPATAREIVRAYLPIWAPTHEVGDLHFMAVLHREGGKRGAKNKGNFRSAIHFLGFPKTSVGRTVHGFSFPKDVNVFKAFSEYVNMCLGLSSPENTRTMKLVSVGADLSHRQDAYDSLISFDWSAPLQDEIGRRCVRVFSRQKNTKITKHESEIERVLATVHRSIERATETYRGKDQQHNLAGGKARDIHRETRCAGAAIEQNAGRAKQIVGRILAARDLNAISNSIECENRAILGQDYLDGRVLGDEVPEFGM